MGDEVPRMQARGDRIQTDTLPGRLQRVFNAFVRACCRVGEVV